MADIRKMKNYRYVKSENLIYINYVYLLGDIWDNHFICPDGRKAHELKFMELLELSPHKETLQRVVSRHLEAMITYFVDFDKMGYRVPDDVAEELFGTNEAETPE